MTTIIGLISGVLCAALVFKLISLKHGDKPIGRALSVIFVLGIGIGYFILEENLSKDAINSAS